MAEGPASDNLRYFCHYCQREVHFVLPEFQCPNCQFGFIEILESEQEEAEESERESFPNFGVSIGGSGGARTPCLGRTGRARPPNPLDNLTPDFISHLAELRMGSQIGIRPNASPLTGRARPPHPLDNLIPGFISHLAGIRRGGQIGISPMGPNASPFNLGDYAWGNDGLDSITTQLMDLIDFTGPPPLREEQINEIPSVEISQEQAEMKIQCSVCWEDFQLSEQVRKLICEHLFHNNCIVPWLERHGTCPICRKALSEEVAAVCADNEVVAESSDNLYDSIEDELAAESTDYDYHNSIGDLLAMLFRVANHSLGDPGSSSDDSDATWLSESFFFRP